MSGDAVVIMMADESDDCRDVVRYWQELNKGYDCVFGSRFIKGGGAIDYPWVKMVINRLANTFLQAAVRHQTERHHQCLQGIPPGSDRRLPAAHRAALQSDGRNPAQGDRSGLSAGPHPDHLA